MQSRGGREIRNISTVLLVLSRSIILHVVGLFLCSLFGLIKADLVVLFKIGTKWTFDQVYFV